MFDGVKLLENCPVFSCIVLNDTIGLSLDLASFDCRQQYFVHQSEKLILNAFDAYQLQNKVILSVHKLKH